MFKKQFRVKSNTQLKNSEVKALRNQLSTNFPCITPDDLDNVMPRKETVLAMKAICSDEKVLHIYFIQKRPILFLVDNLLFPTVYLLWKLPNIAISFTTNAFVYSKIKSGADLMLPGVLQTPDLLPKFENKTICYVNMAENEAAIAVGVTCLSSCDIQSAEKGKIVNIYHFYGDKLCSAEDMAILPLPDFGIPDFLKVSFDTDINIETDIVEEEPDVESNKENEDLSNSDEFTKTADESVQGISENDNMDELLEYCFLSALKYSKSLQIPILTSTFYKNYMLNACPNGKYLDIKKSSYKKLGVFLKKMMKDGVITLKEQKKGAESITNINKEHEMFIKFYLTSENRPKTNDDAPGDKAGPNIVEEYIVTQSILPLLSDADILKGSRLQASDVRKYVIEFVKKNNCQDETNRGLVKIHNPHLAVICKNDDVVTWETLIDNVFKLMKPCYKLVTADEEKLEKGKIQPINIKVETRSGNKKVTLVDNLEVYGIRLSEFSKECQHGVATSTTINKLPGRKYEQLLIQGNQVLFVYNHLIDKYKIPKKYIKGLEYAPKNKK